MNEQDALAAAVKDVCWKAVQYGTTEDGDTHAYLVPKGAMHRLIGAAQSAGINASFRVKFDPDYSKCPECGDLPDEALENCGTCRGEGVLLTEASTG